MSKKIIFLFVFATFLLNQGFSDEKIYISAENVYFSQNSIFVEINGELVNVSSLFTDEQGLHIRSNSIAPELKKWKTWTCPECGYENSFDDSVCQNSECPSRN